MYICCSSMSFIPLTLYHQFGILAKLLILGSFRGFRGQRRAGVVFYVVSLQDVELSTYPRVLLTSN
jgi:hypothetical protein